MRRGTIFKGLKSKFNRFVRKVKLFFGWRERDDEAAQEAAELTAAGLQAEETDTEKPNDDDGDGGGDDGGNGGDPAPSHGRRVKTDDTPKTLDEPKTKPRYGEDRKPINYAKPPDMSDEEWERRMDEKRRAQKQRQKQTERQRRDAEKQREQRRTVRRQREQRQRVAWEETDAKARDERKEESPQAKLERVKASLPTEEPAKKDDGPEFC